MLTIIGTSAVMVLIGLGWVKLIWSEYNAL